MLMAKGESWYAAEFSDVGLPGVRLWGLALYVYTLFDGEYSRSLAV
jgi:hypothetical protein